MTDDAAATLLHEVAELRRRTRRDRHAYWPPMLLLGVLVLAAPLVYGRAVLPPLGTITETSTPHWRIPGTDLVFMPLQLFGPGFGFVGDPMPVAVYWLCVVVLGVAATMAWYRWRGARIGLETSPRTFVLVGIAGLLFLFGILPLVAAALRFPYFGYSSALGIAVSVAVFVVFAALSVVALRSARGVRRPSWRGAVGWIGVAVALLAASSLLYYASIQGYAPLLVIAVALLALAVVERSTLCGVIAVLFALAALLVNLYNMENLFVSHAFTDDPRLIAFAHVLLPGAVLIIGGVAAGLVTRRMSR